MEAFEAYLARCPRALVLLEEGLVRWVNEAAARLLLRDASALIGQPLDLVGGVRLEELGDTSVEVALWAGDGSLLDCIAEVTVLGEAVMVELDLVELSGVDDAGRALRALADTLSLGVFISDRGLRLGYVNAGLATLLATSRERLSGAGWVDIFAPEDRPVVRELALRALGGERVEAIIDVQLASGPRRALEVTIMPVRASDGRLSFVGTVADRSVQRRDDELGSRPATRQG